MQLGPCLRFSLSPPPSLSLSLCLSRSLYFFRVLSLSLSVSLHLSLSLPLSLTASHFLSHFSRVGNAFERNRQITAWLQVQKKGVDVMLYDFSRLTVWKLRAVL